MQNTVHPSVATQFDKIRADIREHGESHVGCDELFLLCPTEISNAQELNGIAQIAEWERWTFEYLPDGSVRFSNL
jgi:hypothetical protein